MAAAPETVIMAMFCDFENVALGVRDAKYEKFDIKPILERLLLKGSIVVKKAYCDWDRYKGFKSTMHEANFELIEIPHVRLSGKNSADIRMVVDALDLCYTKSHVNTFVIVSGDSDFSPLVSKLRENAKYVIGVGVKQSTSDLLIANCDEFIYYDDLVRESQRSVARRDPRAAVVPRLAPEELERRKAEAVELAVQTFEALVVERGETGKIWASMLKDAIKRRKPGFNEGYYGFRSFGNLLDEAQARGLFEVGRDEKSGAYVSRTQASAAEIMESVVELPPAEPQETKVPEASGEPVPQGAATPLEAPAKRRSRGRGKSAAKAGREAEAPPVQVEPPPPVMEVPPAEPEPASAADAVASAQENEPAEAAPREGLKAEKKKPARPRRPRKAAVAKKDGNGENKAETQAGNKDTAATDTTAG
ncbi:NYN domain-containing protein [Propionivibrio limicola]|uniref:NYN domain-containing protein n=1 Tax=Propionivibrio limicola TaxID=167645 RepID=UPI0012917BFE|nr:NYN domain-containing protein [Propionivibrio limicola]